jgi:uncharacterized protein YoxC
MIMMINDIMMNIAQMGVAFSLLIAAVYYFQKKEKAKDVEIQELNKIIREIEKENLTTLYKVISILEKNDEILIKELNSVKDSIERKIDGLKK